MIVQENLLEPSGRSPITESANWVTYTLLGEIALGLCVLAVAFIGFAMLSGRLPVGRGLRVVLGCFVLLGAPVIAASLIGGVVQQTEPSVAVAPPAGPDDPRGGLEPSDYDPYAGASFRTD